MADREELRSYELEICSDPYDLANEADALVFVTAWPDFRTLDFKRIKASMRRPVVIDAQNALDANLLIREGFTYLGVGRGTTMETSNV